MEDKAPGSSSSGPANELNRWRDSGTSRDVDEAVTARPPGEYLLLACLGGSFAYCGYEALTGTLRLEGGGLAIAIFVAGMAVGVLAFLLIIMRQKLGAILCAAFFGIQVFSVVLASGGKWGFNSLPTIYIRIQAGTSVTTTINLGAVLLLCLSLALWASYRHRAPALQ